MKHVEMMKIGLVCATIVLLFSRNAGALEHRVTGGLEVDSMMSDVDSAAGAYVTYEVDLPEPISVMLDLNYVKGSFSLPLGSGDYTSLAIGTYLIFSQEYDNWKPYLGVGGAFHFNHFDNLEFDDKLSMVWLAGSKYMVSDRLIFDASLRFRTLRVDTEDASLTPNQVDMDAVVLRFGLIYEL